jgi:hypothetical protein
MISTVNRWVRQQARRLPLLHEAMWSLQSVVGRTRPYAGTWDLVARLTREIDALCPRPVSPHDRRILVFAAMTSWTNITLAIAAALAARGAAVDFAWLPYLEMYADSGPVVERFARWSARWPIPQHPRLRILNLLEADETELTPEMAAVADAMSRKDALYLDRRERFTPATVDLGQRLYEFRLQRNTQCMRALLTLARQNPYHHLLTVNGDTLEFGIAYQLARLIKLPVVTFEGHERKGVMITAENSACINYDTRAIWRADEPHVLTPERRERVAARLRKREEPDWKDEYIWRGQLAKIEPEPKVREALRLSPEKPIVLMCPNIAWDAAVLGKTRAFSSMAEWIVETVRWFATRPQFQLVVRCHPGEVDYPSNETAEGLIAETLQPLPEHIRVVLPGEPINTYGLMRFSDLALAYTSTVGLEMAVRGLPVITAGQVHYAGKGFTTDPSNREEYFAALEAVTASPQRLTPRQVELAWCYTDVYFEEWPRPFPWSLADLQADLGTWPLRRLFSDEGTARFGDVFATLAGDGLASARQEVA